MNRGGALAVSSLTGGLGGSHCLPAVDAARVRIVVEKTPA